MTDEFGKGDVVNGLTAAYGRGHKLGHDPVVISNEDGFAAGGQTHVFAQLVLEDLQANGSHENDSSFWKLPESIRTSTAPFYYPDFIIRLRTPWAGTSAGPYVTKEDISADETLNLIVEVSGEVRKDKAAKSSTARTLWVPAVNNDGRFGRWAFVEVTDPWDAQRTIRALLAEPWPCTRGLDIPWQTATFGWTRSGTGRK